MHIGLVELNQFYYSGGGDEESEEGSGDESVRDEEAPRTPVRDPKGKGRASTGSTAKVKSISPLMHPSRHGLNGSFRW
jgi:hypothetical protein